MSRKRKWASSALLNVALGVLALGSAMAQSGTVRSAC